jgi:hypothetical protein
MIEINPLSGNSGISAMMLQMQGAGAASAAAPVAKPENNRAAEPNTQPIGYSVDDEIEDTAEISDFAKSLLKAEMEDNMQYDRESKQENFETRTEENRAQKELSAQEEAEVRRLQQRDTEVKAHEQAHVGAAAGLNVSAPSYEYKEGPDGERYATAGEVSISFHKSDNPEENIAKAETMKSAAMAPAEPSRQDYAVAREADNTIREETAKLAEKEVQERDDKEEAEVLGMNKSDEAERGENLTLAS